MAPKAWQTLSKKLIGPHHSSSISIRVSKRYINHKLLAVRLIRGLILSWVMPVTSALNICMPPEWLSMGMTASVNRIIPMPPIHCIMARHRCTPWLMSLTEFKTVAPVVVKPDMASKKASLYDRGLLQKGMESARKAKK